MNNQLRFNNPNKDRPLSHEMLKITALVYLTDALNAQRFEECPSLIRKARKFGAPESEIRRVIAVYLEGIKPKPRKGSSYFKKGRRF